MNFPSARPLRRPRAAWSAPLLAASLLGLGACASLPGGVPLGTPIAQVRQMLIRPTAEYPLRDGATRLEYSQGRQTFMLDFDAGGALVANQQVLDEAHFAQIKPGMTDGDVLVHLGRPVQVFGAGWQPQKTVRVWNYRYWGGDCVWFQVSISDATHQVTESGIGSDPACDVKGRDS